MTGDPDVLEYYKNDHAKKPIRVIDLNLCEQVDAGLTFNKKDLEHSFIFDIKTIDRVFYLVADTEEEMNKWVRCICDICGFNPTDDEAAKAAHQSAIGGLVVDTPPHPALGNIVGPAAAVLSSVPPPYQPVSVRHLDSQSSSEEPQDYLWLVNCESKKPEPNRAHAECSKSTSSETDLNDNLPSHRTPTSSTSSAKHTSHNGFFPQHPAPASASSIYDSPPSRGASLSTDSGLYNLPRSYSQDTVLLPKSASSPPAHPDTGDASELYVFNTPSRKPSVETQIRNLSISYDIPPTPGANCTYQVPRTVSSSTGLGGSEGGGDVVPPPRPPKPSLSSTSGPPPPPAERSPTDTYHVPRSASETDGNYCVPTSAGNKALRSNTIGTVDCTRLRRDFGSQDCYDIPRSFPSDKSCSFDFNESFSSYFKNKGMMPVGSQSTEEVDQNYVPMSANSPSHHHSGSLPEPMHEPNYVPMTPSTMEFSSLGKQVPPPAHMGFRSSPKTPPRRPMLSECQPPPVDRNLKPDRKGQSPKIIRAKGVGLERTDSQTVGEFPRGRRKGKPAPLEIKPLPEWEEPCTPVRSPVTRSFARDLSRFPMPTRPPSVHSTASSTDSEDCDDNYVAMVSNMSTDEPNMKLGAPMATDGGSSPMVKPKGDKQVEYLDLDLDPGKSTPPRKMKSNGTGMAASDERVDYVVVDQQRTQALKSTREAWNDGRQSTETDTPSKGPK
ncbi:GRB2-associated-binding protein 1 isoform X1 [Anabas testudineus]|nr:GRB2-associated-binding protein 1 isoform X1 [Anabas testudineus]XP_026214997.1 GRB2-associated-binding protein 1 isoform X1 [Anabas testudineus]XP_026214998.1 GRB2-associated-binding protein 1 isoform X1 [Anabas testudineus]